MLKQIMIQLVSMLIKPEDKMNNVHVVNEDILKFDAPSCSITISCHTTTQVPEPWFCHNQANLQNLGPAQPSPSTPQYPATAQPPVDHPPTQGESRHTSFFLDQKKKIFGEVMMSSLERLSYDP